MNRNAILFILFFIAAQCAFSQSISGWVIDKDSQQPMIGVAVGEKGTGNGTSTDVDGKFSITPAKFPCTLQFFFVGSQYVEMQFSKTSSGVNVELIGD
jgi:hypothetical protein